MLIGRRDEAVEKLRSRSEAYIRETFIDCRRRVRSEGINIMKNKGRAAD